MTSTRAAWIVSIRCCAGTMLLISSPICGQPTLTKRGDDHNEKNVGGEIIRDEEERSS